MDDKGQSEQDYVKKVDSFVAFLGWNKEQLVGFSAAKADQRASVDLQRGGHSSRAESKDGVP